MFGRVRAWALAVIVGAAGLLFGCVGLGIAPTASVTGTATYRERMALPPEAVFEATLEDVSGADAPAQVVASARVNAPRLPIAFTIGYDPARIAAGRRYAVRGRITLDGRLLFTSDTAHPVLGPADVRHVDMMLRRVAVGITGGETRRWVGLYRYMADAASFFDCASGDQFPVAPEGEGAALQAAYLAVRTLPGDAHLAAVEARLVMRAPEPGRPPRPALHVERVLGVTAQKACEPAAAAPAGQR